MDKEEVIKFIEEAFDNVEQPKIITLHVAEAHDNYEYDNDDKYREKDSIGLGKTYHPKISDHVRMLLAM